MTDGLLTEGDGGTEIRTLHIAQDGLPHLACHRALVEMAGDVHRGHQQAASGYVGLYQHAQLTADVPGVDGLYGRLIVARQLHQVHHLRLVEQLPPVQVRPVVGREVIAEQGVRLVDVAPRGVRWAHLEPRRIPEDGQIGLLDIAAKGDPSGSRQQHRAARTEGTQGFVIEGRGDEGLPFPTLAVSEWRFGIDPEIPVILEVLGHLHGERQFGRTLKGIEGKLDDAQGMALANGEIGRRQLAAGVETQRVVGDDIVDRYVGDGTPQCIVALDGNAQRVAIGIDELGEACQQDDRIAEFAPLGRRAVALLAPEGIEHPFERRALAAVVVEPQQLESAVVTRPQVALYLVLVAERLQLAAGMQELLGHRRHAAVSEQVAEYLEVLSFVGTAVLTDLLEVGEGAPLPLLVCHDGRAVGHRVLVVAREAYLLVVVVGRLWCPAVPVKSSCPTLHVVLRTAVPCPSATDGRAAVDLRGIIGVHLPHPVVGIGDPVAGRLIAGSHHHERRMIAVGVDDALRLVEQILVDIHAATQLDAMIGPRRTFRLQVDAQLVGRLEGSLWRAIAVETHHVEPVLLALTQDAQPLVNVRRGIARIGEEAVLYRTTNERRHAVDVELWPLDGDVAQAERRLIDIIAGIDHQTVDHGRELAPRIHLRVHVYVVLYLLAAVEFDEGCRQDGMHVRAPFAVDLADEAVLLDLHDVDAAQECVGMILEVDYHMGLPVPYVGIYPDATDIDFLRSCLQFQASCDAVPVALRLVGDAVRVLSHADILYTIIYFNSYLIVASHVDVLRDVVDMGRGEAHLVAHFMPVDEERRLYVRTFEEERHTLIFPCLRDIDGTPIPGIAYIVSLGREEEGELHVALMPVFLHRRVVEIG